MEAARTSSQTLARVYLTAIILAGAGVLGQGILEWQSRDPFRFLVFLAIACMASGMKVVLPSVNGTMSAHFLFVLIGLAQFSRQETTVMACLGIAIQTLWQARKRPRPVQVAFNLASMALSVAAAYSAYEFHWTNGNLIEAPLLIGVGAASFFLVNTVSVAAIIAITESRPLLTVWRDGYFWSFPIYLAGAAVAALIQGLSKWVGWQTALLSLPVLYLVHNFHKLYVERLEKAKRLAEQEREHEREKSGIHLRTIKALAMAIEAKDGTTHEHLERVQIYALEVGKDLGLTSAELEALRAASILHDIGKLAVPEYIISKPGKLTHAEFEKVKIHPGVGAKILEQVQFPYPVSPIVRSHHEKWDGSGYPDGLKGEDIPIGARILSAVDCLDALASDRQYRRALPLPEAMGVLVKDAGKAFDPRVVEVLSRRYVELEEMARRSQSEGEVLMELDMRVERGEAPAAGFAAGEMTLDVAKLCSRLKEERHSRAFSDFAADLRKQVAFDAMAIFIERTGSIAAVYSEGTGATMLSELRVPVGSGLLGWVAENHKPIVNGNPAVDPGFRAEVNATLVCTLAIPVEPDHGPLGIIGIYSTRRDTFTRADLRVVQSMSVAIAQTLESEAVPA